jgi:hypothetical protein
VHLTQIEIDPRREQAAENCVHDHDREVVRMKSWHADMPNAKFGLWSISLAHQVHGAR